MGENPNFFNIFLNSGLVVQLVVLGLILASIFSWTIFFRKKKEFKVVQQQNTQFLNSYRKMANLNEILKLAKQTPLSSYALLFQRGYGELIKISDRLGPSEGPKLLHLHFSQFGFQAIERSLKHASNEMNERLACYLSPLASIGSIGPFVGLLGTVWGIMRSFMGLSSGQAALEAVAPGIAEALVATAIGLGAAIPAVLFFNFFNNEIEKFNSGMDSFGQDFLNMVERSLISKVKNG